MNRHASPFLAWTVSMNLFFLFATATTSSSFSSGEFSLCNSTAPAYIGDSYCNSYNNNEDCGYDGGDCCECTCEGDLCGARVFECIDPSAPCVNSPFDTPAPTIVASLPPVSGITAPTMTAEILVPTAVTKTQSPAVIHPLITLSPTSTPTSSPTFWPPLSFRFTSSLATEAPATAGPISECDVYGGNGFCDRQLNNPDCEHDKGDCCLCACVDGVKFECGYNGFDCTGADETCAPTPTPTRPNGHTPTRPPTPVPIATETPSQPHTEKPLEPSMEPTHLRPTILYDIPTSELRPEPTPSKPTVSNDPTANPTRRPTGGESPLPRPSVTETVAPTTTDPVATQTPEEHPPLELNSVVIDPRKPLYNHLTPEPIASPSPAAIADQPSKGTPPPLQQPTFANLEPTITPTPDLTNETGQTPGTTPEPFEPLVLSKEPTPLRPTTLNDMPISEPSPEPTPFKPTVSNDPTASPMRGSTRGASPFIPPSVTKPVAPTTMDPVATQTPEGDPPIELHPVVINPPKPTASSSPAVIDIQSSTRTPPPLQQPASESLEPTITPTSDLTNEPMQTPGITPEPSEWLESTMESTIPRPTTLSNEPTSELNPQPTPSKPIISNDSTAYPTRRPTREPTSSIPPVAFEPIVPTTPYPVATPNTEVASPTESDTVVSPTLEPHGIPTSEPTATPSPAAIVIQPSHEPARSPTTSGELADPLTETPPPRQQPTSGSLEPTITPTSVLTGVPRQTPGTTPEPSEWLESSMESTIPRPTTLSNEPTSEPNPQPTPSKPIVPNDSTAYPTRRPTREPTSSIPPVAFEPIVPATPYPVATPNTEVASPTESDTVVRRTLEPHGIPTPEPTATPSPAAIVIQPSHEPARSPTTSGELADPLTETPPPRQQPTSGSLEPTITPTSVLTGVPRQTPGTTPEPSELPELNEWLESTMESTIPRPTTLSNEPTSEPNPQPTPSKPIVPNDSTAYPTRRPTREPTSSIPPVAFEPIVPTTPHPVATPNTEVALPTEPDTGVRRTLEPHGIPTSEPTATPSPAAIVIQPSHEPARSPTTSGKLADPLTETPPPRQQPTSGSLEPTITPTSVLTGVPRQTPGTTPEPSEWLESTMESTIPRPTTLSNEPTSEPNPQPTPSKPIVPNDSTAYPTRRPTREPTSSIPPVAFEPIVPTTPYPVATPNTEVASSTESDTGVRRTLEPHGIPTPEPTATPSPAAIVIQPSHEPARSPTTSGELTYPLTETPPPRQQPTSGSLEPTITPTFVLTGVPRQTPGTTPEPSEWLESSMESTIPRPTTLSNELISERNPQPTPSKPIVPNDSTAYPTRRPTRELTSSIPPFAFEPIVPTTPYPVATPNTEVASPTESDTVVSPTLEPHGIPAPEPTATPSPAAIVIQPSHEPVRSPTTSGELTYPLTETPPPRQQPTSGSLEPTITPTSVLTGVPRQTPGTTPEPSEWLESTMESTIPRPTTLSNEPTSELNPQPTPSKPIVPNDSTAYPTRRPTREPTSSIPPVAFEPIVPTTPYPVATPNTEVASPTESDTVVSPTLEPHGIPTPEPTATPSPAAIVIQPSHEPARSPTTSGKLTYPLTKTPPPRQQPTSGSLEPTITPTSVLTGVPRQTPGTTPEPSELAMPTNNSPVSGGNEAPTTRLGSSPQPGAAPMVGAPAIPTAMPNRQPAAANGSPESGENASWTTLGSSTLQPGALVLSIAPTMAAGSPNRHPVDTNDSSISEGSMAPTLPGYHNAQPWGPPMSRAPVVPPTAVNIQPRTMTDTPVLGGNLAPTAPGAPTAQPRAAPISAMPAFGSTQPSEAENATFSPMASTKSPLILPPGTVTPVVSPATHTPLVSPSPSTSAPSSMTLLQTSTLTPTASSTAYDAPTSVRQNRRATEDTIRLNLSRGVLANAFWNLLVELRGVAIWTVMFITAGGVAVSSLGSMLSQERDVTLLTRPAGTDIQTGDPVNGVPRYTSYRKPSATLSTILISQLQFIATLSLVDYAVEEEPWLRDFCMHLRWVNLWWTASFAEDSTVTSDTTRRTLTGSSVDDSEGIGSMVSIGNLTLVLGLLLCISLLHLLLISGLEALWLSKKRATIELKAAQRCGIVADELYSRMFAGAHEGHFHQRRSFVMPDVDTDTEEGSPANKSEAPLPQPTTTGPWKIAAFEGISVWDAKYYAGGGDDTQDHDATTVQCRRQRAADPIADCRDMSGSVWLHFPHVELLFLFFAFQGIVAAQVAAVRNAQSIPLTIVASVILVLYPLLLLVGVCRTIAVLLRSEETVQFRELRPRNDTEPFSLPSAAGSSGARGLFSQADKGRWYTASTEDNIGLRERNWFRIGFEPLFVDFTQSGVWFAMFSLAECTTFACIAVLVDSSIVQLLLFCAVHTISFIAVVVCRPFANKVIDGTVAALAFTNAVCMVLMSVSTLIWTGTPRAEKTNIAVATVQFIVLCGLAIPAYVDLASAIMKALNYSATARNEVTRSEGVSRRKGEKMRPLVQQIEDDDADAKMFVRRFIRRMWARTWCTLLGNNLSAFMRDIYAGISRPQSRSQIWPQPTGSTVSLAAQESSGRPRVCVVGTSGTPLTVGTSVAVHSTATRGSGAAKSLAPMIEADADDISTRDTAKQDNFDGREQT